LFAPPVLKRQKGFIFMQRKLILEANILQLETGGVTIRDFTINFNTGSLQAGFQLLNVVD
jgi:hypothetical protein